MTPAGKRGEFTCPDYDVLADCPFHIGKFESLSFRFGGVKYEIALSGFERDKSSRKALVDRWRRIVEFFTGQDPSGAGYQINQSLIALGSGGISGVGLANSVQKLYFLPEAHTDFIFAIIGEELGLLGCLALITLFGLFLWRGLGIAAQADSPLGTYLGFGIVTMVIVQALINMSVVVKLLPTKGIPLPFISVGGSSLMIMLAACGILLNISKHRCRR